MFAGVNENLKKSIAAIETRHYEELGKLNDIKWDSDFLFLVSCELPDEKIILIFRQPYEYLYDSDSVLYQSVITGNEYYNLCEIAIPFSTYLFKNGKLIKAQALDGEDLFERYDFSLLMK